MQIDEPQTRAFIRAKIHAGAFTACSLVFGKRGERLVEIHEGTLGAFNPRAVDRETSFDLQSITKAVATAPIAMKLAIQRRPKLEDTIEPVIREASIKNVELARLSYANLLTHTSGLSDDSLAGEFETPTALWNHMLDCGPTFEPGTRIEYTDLGYRVLGKALEILLKQNLEVASENLIWRPAGLKNISFLPRNFFNIAATPDASGRIDDEQVHFLGGVLGCDGVFGSANDLFDYVSQLSTDKEMLQLMSLHRTHFHQKAHNFYEQLAIGNKTLGWEVNDAGFSYAGKLRSNKTYEKAGGAGTFIWFDPETEFAFVYLTNHGRPKPFDETSWNALIARTGPDELSNLIFGNE